MSTLADEAPTLDGIDLGDDQELAEVVDGYVQQLGQTDTFKAFREEQHVLEGALRAAGPEVWAAYLAVEELRNARSSELLLHLVRWAFTEGARSAPQDGGGP